MRERVHSALSVLRRLGIVGTSLGAGFTDKEIVKGTPLLLFFMMQADGTLITRLRHARENWIEDF